MKKLPSEVKDRVYAEVTDNLKKFMICYTTITSTSNTLKNLLVNASFHYSYTQREFTDKKDTIIDILSAYVEALIKEINHPSLLQERRQNLDAAEYKRYIDANLYKPSEKKKFNCHDSDYYWPTPIK